jgi:ferredoxin
MAEAAMEITLLALNASARLRLNEGACLPLRSHFGGCRACAASCPVKVLDVHVERVALADGCLHCGRCAAACPTEALQLDGFDITDLADGALPIEIECAKVPAAERTAHSVQVPCLGGLSAGRIAALQEAAGERGIALIDRGWCSQCSAGSAQHPAQVALEQITSWFYALQDPRPAPRLLLRPLPAADMPAQIPQLPEPADQGPMLSRRQFFRTLADNPVGSSRTPMGGNGRAAFPASARHESPERRRLLDALTAVADRRGTTIPAEFFPRVANSGACVDHQVCTAACPTGALKTALNADESSLIFSSAACIACGACTRACPERALSLEAGGGQRAPVALAIHRQQACASCGEVFSPREVETTCLACTKSQRFIGDAMSQLFGARN